MFLQSEWVAAVVVFLVVVVVLASSIRVVPEFCGLWCFGWGVL